MSPNALVSINPLVDIYVVSLFNKINKINLKRGKKRELRKKQINIFIIQ